MGVFLYVLLAQEVIVHRHPLGRGKERLLMPDETVETGATEEKTFSQAEVDEIVKKRVAKEKAKYPDYDKYKADSEALSQIQEANKSEIEKANDRASKAEQERDALIAEKNLAAWKAAASEKYNVPVDALEGATEEAINDHAQRLEPYFKHDPAPVIGSDGHTSQVKPSTAEQFARTVNQLRR